MRGQGRSHHGQEFWSGKGRFGALAIRTSGGRESVGLLGRLRFCDDSLVLEFFLRARSGFVVFRTPTTGPEPTLGVWPKGLIGDPQFNSHLS